jgi:hypothetical protein
MFPLSRMACAALVIFVTVVPCLRAQDPKGAPEMAPDLPEKTLQGMKIDFKKSSSKKGDQQYFDFQRGTFRVRLTQFPTQELMLDCVFRGIPLDKVNEWNTITKLSRVAVHKDATGEFTILEYGLDLTGGVTEGILKQYITRFEDELKKYDGFIASTAVDDTILATVSDEKVEGILKTIGVTYQKKVNSAGVMTFDFDITGHKLRLYNFGGKDLMMDVHFRKIALADANSYNLNKKFVRVVNYKSKETEYTALEINLDCEAGVTEQMVRHWIVSFGEDVAVFSDYAKKVRGDSEKK